MGFGRLVSGRHGKVPGAEAGPQIRSHLSPLWEKLSGATKGEAFGLPGMRGSQ